MERVMELDIKVDVLLGFDIDFDAKHWKKNNILEIVHTLDQNKTDLETFDYLYERKFLL
jgi:hypothetical protein